ncbi:multiple epidermal growth factor-like domains protein 10 [Haliotis rubra]|uniref:multiple epidermal growth factor-like domains protein 10 n=1 Tax=Haliotis rubra TaxID=36100 RepID=UPI001EE5F83A|nr:multiple epidermal growth factor-like domains protein 10 [Haliotis rubra]
MVGDYCDNTCPPHCVKCDRHRGQCLACEATRYGENCNLTCNTACLKSQCNLTGDCINGCESGRYGSRCSERCPQVCNNTCQHDGACVTCADGWMGEHCTEPYSLHRQTWIFYAVIGVLASIVLIMAALFIKRHVVNGFAGIYVSPVFNDLESGSDNISLEQLGQSRDSDYRHYEMIQDGAYPQAAGPDEDDSSSEVSAPRHYEPLRPVEDSVEYTHLASVFD